MSGKTSSLWRLARYENGFPFKPEDFGTVGTPVIRIRQLLDSSAEIDLTERQVPSRYLLHDNDLIFSWSGSLAVQIWDRGPAWLNQHLFKVMPGSSIDQRWLRWTIEASIPQFLGMMHGSAMTHLTHDMLKQLTVRYPALDEQRRIADFLDAETARIDALASIQGQARKALLERRAANVFAAVTGSVITERMPSKLAWADSLPMSWQSVKLGHFARMGSGHTPSRSHPEWWENCTIPWITTGEVSQVRDDRLEVLTETRERISEIGMANSSAELHPKGTVVLCRTASAGYSAVMGEDMATSQDFVTWTCSQLLDPYYLLWCLRAMRADLLGRLAMGSTHKTIYVPDLQMLRIPLPPMLEQQQIVTSIRAANSAIDGTVDAIDRQLALLDERRQALITAAVTGGITV